MRARRREDGRANARAAEILAEHRNAWLETERGLLKRLEEASVVEAELRARVESLESELSVAKSTTATAPGPGDDDNEADDGRDKRGVRGLEGDMMEEEEEEEGMVLYEGGEEGLELDEMAAIMYQQRLQMSYPPFDGHGLGPQNNVIFHNADTSWFDLSNPSTNPMPNHNRWQVNFFFFYLFMCGSKIINYPNVPVKVSVMPERLGLLTNDNFSIC